MLYNRQLAMVGAVGLATSHVLGQGTPVTPQTIDSNNSGDCKAIADLDGDGRGDPIVGGSSLSWYESGANFVRHVIRSTPVYDEFTTDMQAVDLDGDGDQDMVIGDGAGNGNVLWFENPRLNTPAGVGSDPRVGSNWKFHVIGSHGTTAHDIEVADLDNDGRVDVVTSGHGATHIWKQVNPTTWQDKNISSMAGAGISVGDIDRDGFKDIATPTGWIGNPHTISGSWTFHAINQTTSGDECLAADFNGDGRIDLMTCDAHNRGPMVWFEAPATPTSASWTKRTIDPSMGAHHPEAADMNGDGKADILMGLELTDLSIYINNGGAVPTFSKNQIDTRCAHNARAGDIDGDGMPDILGCDYIGNPPVRVYINKLAAPAACYANCDGSQIAPVLNANDFQCFLTAFAAGSAYANCDNSSAQPTLNANDFSCFLNQFAAGCP